MRFKGFNSVNGFVGHVAKVTSNSTFGHTGAALSLGVLSVIGVAGVSVGSLAPSVPVLRAPHITEATGAMGGSTSVWAKKLAESRAASTTSLRSGHDVGNKRVSSAITQQASSSTTLGTSTTDSPGSSATTSTTLGTSTTETPGIAATTLAAVSNSTPTTTVLEMASLASPTFAPSVPSIEPIGGNVIPVSSLFNVLSYGADPTGQRDSTNAIIATISAAEALHDDATVYFPSGHYVLTQPPNRLFDFVIASPINIVGAGQGATIIENEVGIDSAISNPPGMFEILGSGGPTPGGADGTIIGDMTLDTRSFQSGTAITDYGNHTVVGNLTVYAPTSTPNYNGNQFGVRVIAVCNPSNVQTDYRVGNLVQNVYITGGGGGGNTELDISCQQNTVVNGATIVGNGVDVYMSRDDSLSNLNLTGGDNGSTAFFTWVITDSQNINMTNIQVTGQAGVIERSSRDTTSNVVVDNEVSNTPSAYMRIGDALSTTIENSRLGGLYLNPSQVLNGLAMTNSTFGKVYCTNLSYVTGLSGLACQ